MRRVVALFIVVLAVAPATATAKDSRRIARDVQVGSVDLSRLTVDRAAKRLEGRYGATLRRDLVVRVSGRTFRLKAGRARLRFDSQLTAVRAYRAGADRPKGQRSTRVGLALTHSTGAAYGFAQSVSSRVSRRPRNARVSFGIVRQRITASRKGRGLSSRALGRRVNRALADPRKRRSLRAWTYRTRPAVTVETLRRAHRTIVTIDRSTFKLRLFKRLRWSKGYGVAVGMAGLDTPAGRYRITNKSVDPVWNVPNSDWAGALAGTTVAGGAPDNPLKARWLGIVNGVGIHGTSEEWSIGTRASHGCIRMRVADVKDLYPRVPVGSTVIIR